MDSLADAYLSWKYNVRQAGTPPRSPMTGASPTPDDENYDFDIPVIDIFTLDTTAHISRPGSSVSAVAALIHEGYLGASPENPQIAISLRTLELYDRIRARKVSFSVEAFSKVLCDFYKVCVCCIMSLFCINSECSLT